jgi:hypothetical protein
MRTHAIKTINSHVRNYRTMVEGLRKDQRYNSERLESIRTLCNDADDTLLFALFLAKKVQTSVIENIGLSLHINLINESVALFEPFVHGKVINNIEMMNLKIQVARLEAVQDLFIPKNGERIRIIKDWNVLVLEAAYNCLLYPKESADRGYKLARHYAEVSIPDRGTGLLVESADRLQDIADFWEDHYKGHHEANHSEATAQAQ